MMTYVYYYLLAILTVFLPKAELHLSVNIVHVQLCSSRAWTFRQELFSAAKGGRHESDES